MYPGEDLFCLGSSGGTTAVLHTYFLSHKLGGFHQRVPNPVGACYMTSRAATISGDPNAEFPPKCYSKNLDGQMRRMRAESNRWHGTARGTNLDLCQGWVG